MADPTGVLDGHADGVTPADEQVAGVEAERDAAAGQHAVGLVTRLDHGADVGVQGREQAVLRGRVRDPVEVGQQRRPLGVVEHRALVVALRAGGGGDDHRGGLCGGERLHGQDDLRQGVGRGVVQHDGHELADGAQPGGGEGARLGLGGVREEPVRAELGGREADLAHLLQHQVRAELVAPARHLAHAPGDRGAGDPVAQWGRRGRVAHLPSFVRWSGRGCVGWSVRSGASVLRRSGSRTARRVCPRAARPCRPRPPGRPPARRARCTGWAPRPGPRRESG